MRTHFGSRGIASALSLAVLLVAGCSTPAPRLQPAAVSTTDRGLPGAADAQRKVPLEGALNVRTFEGLRGSRAPIPANSFLRAAEMNRLTDADRATLGARGVALVLDLRTAEEARSSPDALGAGATARYQRISLLGSEQIDLSALPDSLGEMYVQSLVANKVQFRDVFAMIASQRDGAVLFHCTAGKDRTGMVAAILLSLAGVTREDIIHNYAVSAHYLGQMTSQSSQMADMLRANPKIAALMGSPPEAMEQFLDALEKSHGGARAYLRSIGLGDDEVRSLLVRLGQARSH